MGDGPQTPHRQTHRGESIGLHSNLLLSSVSDNYECPLSASFLDSLVAPQVLHKAHFITESYSSKQVLLTYGQMVHVMDEIVLKNFSEWTHNLDGQYLKRLQNPLLVRCKENPAKLDVNFDMWVT